MSARPIAPPAAPPLSPAEARVAALLGRDDGYGRLARMLGVSVETVRSHAKSIYRKLGVRTRHAAVARLAAFVQVPPGGANPAREARHG